MAMDWLDGITDAAGKLAGSYVEVRNSIDGRQRPGVNPASVNDTAQPAPMSGPVSNPSMMQRPALWVGLGVAALVVVALMVRK